MFVKESGVPQSGVMGITHSRGKWLVRQRVEKVGVVYVGSYYDLDDARKALADFREKFASQIAKRVISRPGKPVVVIGEDGKQIPKSGIKGVKLEPYEDYPPWVASIHANGKKNHLGRFDTPADAALAYCVAFCDLEKAYSAIRTARESGISLSVIVSNGLDLI